MPSLIRFLIVIAVLAAIGFGTLIGLAVFVHPADKDVTIRLPARELFNK